MTLESEFSPYEFKCPTPHVYGASLFVEAKRLVVREKFRSAYTS